MPLQFAYPVISVLPVRPFQGSSLSVSEAGGGCAGIGLALILELARSVAKKMTSKCTVGCTGSTANYIYR